MCLMGKGIRVIQIILFWGLRCKTNSQKFSGTVYEVLNMQTQIISESAGVGGYNKCTEWNK